MGIIYRQYWTNARKVRFKLEIRPRGLGLITGPTSEGGFVSTGYMDLPADAQLAISGGPKVNYDKLIWGMPDATMLSLEIDLGRLSALGFDDLVDAITDPYDDSHDLDLGDDQTRKIRTSTVYTLYTNDGVDGTEPARVIFQGAQNIRPALRGKILWPGSPAATNRIQVNLLDMARICMGTVTPDDLSTWIRNNWGSKGPHGVLYDTIFRKNALVHVRAYAGSNVTNGSTNFAYFWNMQAVRGAIWDLCRQVYRANMRQLDANFQTNLTTPLDHITFRKQKHDGSTGPGAVLELADMWITGAVNHSGGSGYPDAFMGLLINGGKESQSVYRVDSVYDLLKIWVESAFLKAEVVPASTDTVRFVKIFDNRSGGPRSIASNLIENNKEIPWQMPGRSIKGTKYAVPGMSGEDIANNEIFSRHKGIETEEKRTVRVLFHNLPHVGDRKDYYRGRAGDVLHRWEFDPLPDITHDHVAIVSPPPYPMWNLWYFDTPNDGSGSLTNAEIPIRVHSHITIDIGDGKTWEFGIPFFNWPEYPTSLTDYDPANTDWPDKMLDRLLEAQKTTGLPVAMATLGSRCFGAPDTVIWEGVTVASTVVDHTFCGEWYTIGSGNANTFMPGKTHSAFLSTHVAVVSGDTDIHKGTTKLDLLHFSDAI